MSLRFVTIVTPEFWPGFAALVQSLTENAGLGEGGYEVVAICDEAQAPQAWLDARTERITLFPVSKLPKIELLSAQNQGARMENALQKLGVFALPEDWGKCIFIDSDIVCLGSLSGLGGFPALTAAPDMPIMESDLPPNPLADPEFEYNTGLFVFEPSARVFAELQEVYRLRHHERTHKGDQDVFNLWVRERGVAVHLLGSEWNFAKRYQDFLGSRWIADRMDRIRTMHFVGVKPWTSNRDVSTFRECHYRWLEELWWDYFDRSGFAAHVAAAPHRSRAFLRQFVLPFTSPVILKEHCVRAGRLARRMLRVQAQN